MPRIHPTAIVEDGARLGADVEVGPYAHIGADVKIGDGTLHYKYKDGKVSARLEGCPAELVVLPVSGQTDSPVFDGVGFCRPDPLDSCPCFETYHETALTY